MAVNENGKETDSIDMTEAEFDAKILEGIIERNPHLLSIHPIHRRRWMLFTVWLVIFTCATGYAIRQNRENINELKKAKANLVALQHTNCGLKLFLLTAKQARLAAANSETGNKRFTDLQAYRGYVQLLRPFTKDSTGNCPVPKSLRG